MHVREYTLGELADVAAMTERNVRAYGARGLLPPSRRQGRRVSYGAEHVARLRLIRSLHRRGLTLRVIGDLVERGTADAELARLGREDLATGTDGDTVPMSAEIVETYARQHPGGMDALVEARLVAFRDGRHVASAATLGIVSALSARGIGVADSARISLCAAQAATACAPDLRVALDAITERSTPRGEEAGVEHHELAMLVVQLAASAFADVVTVRLSRPGP